MEKQTFETLINASSGKVWDVLWNDATYRQWTSPFSESSYAVTDWKKGSKALFLDDKGSGMVSAIEESIPNEFMSIKHLGVVQDGVEDTESAAVKAWSGAHENYTLKTVDGKTKLTIDMDVADSHKDYFLKTWPIALEKVKELAEKH